MEQEVAGSIPAGHPTTMFLNKEAIKHAVLSGEIGITDFKEENLKAALCL